MADWRDGADYAPTERPFGFAVPRAEALETPAEPPSPAQDRPVQPPRTFAAPDAAPLATLTPRVTTGRDPQQPFDTDSAAFQGDTAWGHDEQAGGQQWTPTQPLWPSGDAPASADPNGTEPDRAMSFPPPSGAPFAPPTGVPVVAPQPYPAPPYPTPQFPDQQPFPVPPQSPVPWPAYPPQVAGQQHPAQQQYPAPNPYPGAPPYPVQQYPNQPYPVQPYPGQPWPVAPQPPAKRFTGMDALVLAGLFIGLVALPLSVPAIAAAWLVARSQRPRRRGIVRTLLGGLVLAVLLGTLDILGEDSPMRTWTEFNVFGEVTCLVLLVAVGIQLLVQRRR